ncbi:hypothetical protein PHLGIDRAFT_66022, partial [Phlebiopsis gigantea 11061_1 CR5-6]
SASQIRASSIWIAGYLLMHAGATLRLACYRALGRFFTFELVIKKGHVLVTSGPYSIVRHPGYTAVWMITIGVLLCQTGPGSWYMECVGWSSVASRVFLVVWVSGCMFIPAGLMARVRVEDAILLQEFGHEWTLYSKSTPWKLFPYLY